METELSESEVLVVVVAAPVHVVHVVVATPPDEDEVRLAQSDGDIDVHVPSSAELHFLKRFASSVASSLSWDWITGRRRFDIWPSSMESFMVGRIYFLMLATWSLSSVSRASRGLFFLDVVDVLEMRVRSCVGDESKLPFGNTRYLMIRMPRSGICVTFDPVRGCTMRTSTYLLLWEIHDIRTCNLIRCPEVDLWAAPCGLSDFLQDRFFNRMRANSQA